ERLRFDFNFDRKLTDEEIKLHGALSQTIEEFHRGLGAQVEQQLYILSSRDDIFREVKQRLAYCFWAYGQILQQDPDPPEFGMVLLPSPAAVNSPDLEGILRKMYTFFRTSGLKNFRTEEDFANPFREYAQSFMNMPQNRIVYPLEALKGRRGIFLEDLHYTVEGNTAVAELIAQNILADPGYLKRLQNSPVSKKRGLIIPQGEVRPFKPQGTRPSRKIGHRNKQEEFKPTSGDKALLSFAHSLRGRRPQIFKPQMWLRGH
ncbi:hypothetical protein HYU13_03390, partial [Candidatus Woesearchaeota archaeon]|nr:hypothetical protein [Candidatus Woesearchaeota archaeon]